MRNRWSCGIVVAAMAVGGCGASGAAAPSDTRFAPFTEQTFRPVEVVSQVAETQRRFPGLELLDAHTAGAPLHDDRGIPDHEPWHWYNAVLKISVADATSLSAEALAPAEKLPGLVAELYEFVPQECTFETVPHEVAKTELGYEQQLHSPHTFNLGEVAISRDCQLLLLTARYN